MSLVKGRCECLEHKLGQGVPGSGELRHKEVPFGRVMVDRPVTIGIVVRRIHDDVLQGDHLRYGIIREPQSRILRGLSMIDILEQKVSCAAIVQCRHPIDCTTYDIHQRDTGGLRSCQERVGANVIRADPQGVYSLIIIEL